MDTHEQKWEIARGRAPQTFLVAVCGIPWLCKQLTPLAVDEPGLAETLSGHCRDPKLTKAGRWHSGYWDFTYEHAYDIRAAH